MLRDYLAELLLVRLFEKQERSDAFDAARTPKIIGGDNRLQRVLLLTMDFVWKDFLAVRSCLAFDTLYFTTHF